MVQPFKMDQMQATQNSPAARPLARTKNSRAMQQAFTLVELSIVLAIIGLLVGATLATTTYLKNARMRTTVNEGKYYLNALSQFQHKYDGALPGDLGNASDYWNGASNGNGNAAIEAGSESFMAFKHLQLAELISGKFTGLAGGGGAYDAIIGQNVPPLSIEGATGWYNTFSSDSYVTGSSALYDGTYGTSFILARPSASTMPWDGFLSPRDALEVDGKFDDGQPDKGWIRTRKDNASCVSGTAYLVTDSTNACALILSGL